MRRLPDFVPPMLARTAEAPFDSEDHLFEVKWDGFRALAFVEPRGFRLTSRRRVPLDARFPELEVLRGLPPGTLADGEIVILKDGVPHFESLLARERGAAPRGSTALYVAFDLLHDGFEPILDEPLTTRRERLRERVLALGDPRVVFSEGVTGEGRRFTEQAIARGLEGAIAKRLDSPYRPGERSDAWLKIKRQQRLPCLILGFVEREHDLRSLVLAAEVDSVLRPVGRVGSGFDARLRQELLPRLEAMVRPEPFVPCDDPEATWVEPELYCIVRFVEWTGAGQLRAPVFETLLETP